MKQSLVSVIIPAFRCAAYLPQAIESALAQTGTRVELIVVNDGSPDDTDEVVRPYIRRLQYIRQENRGLSAARNAGFRASNGEFVCFLDADDAFLPGKLEAQLTVFEHEPDLGVVISGYIDIEEDGLIEIQRVRKPWHRDALERLLGHEVFPPFTALVRRSALERSSLFPEDIDTWESQEDWQLWLELALSGVEFSSFPEPTGLFRYRTGSIRRNPLRHNDGARRVVRWLRAGPALAAHARKVDRLDAIVELERAALAARAGLVAESRAALRLSLAAGPVLWERPEAFRRLFLASLPLPEAARWVARPDIDAMEHWLLGGVLEVEDTMGEKQARGLRALALLACANEDYAAGNGRTGRNRTMAALRTSSMRCLTSGTLRAVGRGLLGPGVGRVVGKGLRVLGEGLWAVPRLASGRGAA